MDHNRWKTAVPVGTYSRSPVTRAEYMKAQQKLREVKKLLKYIDEELGASRFEPEEVLTSADEVIRWMGILKNQINRLGPQKGYGPRSLAAKTAGTIPSGHVDRLVDHVEREIIHEVEELLDYDVGDELEVRDLAPWRSATRRFIRRMAELAPKY